LQEDEVLPQASSIKIAVLAELYHQAQLSTAGTTGKAKLTDLYAVETSDLVPDSDIMLGLTPSDANYLQKADSLGGCEAS